MAENYLNRLEVLDVGFWDTRALRGEPGGLRGRAADVGRVLADMGLDVWCFSEADPPAIDAICERLWAAHGLSYQPIPFDSPSPDGDAPGVLIRPSKTLAAEPVADGLPHRVRIRAATRLGGEVEFCLVPATRDAWHVDLACAVRREASRGGPNWLVLTVADLAPRRPISTSWPMPVRSWLRPPRSTAPSCWSRAGRSRIRSSSRPTSAPRSTAPPASLPPMIDLYPSA